VTKAQIIGCSKIAPLQIRTRGYSVPKTRLQLKPQYQAAYE
jgi:hypothetical protein